MMNEYTSPRIFTLHSLSIRPIIIYYYYSWPLILRSFYFILFSFRIIHAPRTAAAQYFLFWISQFRSFLISDVIYFY